MLFVNFCANAQTDSIRLEQNFIFQHINKALIPSGYLNEYEPEVVEKKWLTGLLNDSNNFKVFKPNSKILSTY